MRVLICLVDSSDLAFVGLLSTLQLPFLCIHGANDTIALPRSSQYVLDHTGTPAALKSIFLVADSKHEPFHEGPAIRTAALECVVNYFEAQYSRVLSNGIGGGVLVSTAAGAEDRAGEGDALLGTEGIEVEEVVPTATGVAGAVGLTAFEVEK